jgi:hypothetical protein
MHKRIVCLLILFLGVNTLLRADVNPAPLLDSIKTNLNKVNDYSASVNIKVNVSFIKIPVKEGVLYYKKPDKVKLESKGFAMLPKKGMNFGLNELFSKPYSSIFVREEKIKNKTMMLVKVIPMDDESDIVLATLWINRAEQKIYKVEAVSKSSGKSLVEFVYPEVANPFHFPSSLIFTFEVNKAVLPMGVTGDFDNVKPKDDDGKPKKAILTVNYSNYKVNQGLSDQMFIEEKKK